MSVSDEDDYPYTNYEIGIRGGPPLIKTKSRIIHCVVNNDVEGLKSLINYPNLFQIADSWGYPIFQIAILKNNIAVFDLLLSQDDCPLETLNKDGETALEVALTDHVCNHRWMDEHFALSLLKKGAKIDYVCHLESNSLLHCALDRSFFKVARFLIEKGADLNYQNDKGITPICKVFDTDDMNEALAMMLYFGADPSVTVYQNFSVLDLVLTKDNFPPSMKETLLFYLFDDHYSTGYDIPIDTLFQLFETEPSLFPQILKHITSVNMDRRLLCQSLYIFYIRLFLIKPEYLKLLLEKFDYVIDEILNTSHIQEGFGDYPAPADNPAIFQNFELLLRSRFSSDVIQVIINGASFDRFIARLRNSSAFQIIKSFESIMLLLSYGANIRDYDLEKLYEVFGDCEYFRILLHMDVQVEDKHRHWNTIMPSLSYNIHFELETFLLDHDSKFSHKILMELLNYFAHPKLKHFCCSLPVQNEEINIKVKNLPSVPLLVELARNEARKFLIQKYNITNSMQFYTLIKHLPISEIHEKIITFKTKLYLN